jgi:hypothetical protein
MTGVLVAIVGWSAAALILTAYVLLSLDKVKSSSFTYQWMNIVAAAGFIVNSGYNGAMPSAVVNILWMGIGLFAVSRMLRRRAATAAPAEVPPPLRRCDSPPG